MAELFVRRSEFFKNFLTGPLYRSSEARVRDPKIHLLCAPGMFEPMTFEGFLTGWLGLGGPNSVACYGHPCGAAQGSGESRRRKRSTRPAGTRDLGDAFVNTHPVRVSRYFPP